MDRKFEPFPCGCGCGSMAPAGKGFLPGHDKFEGVFRSPHNVPHSLTGRNKISQSLLNSDKQIGRSPGFHHSDETLEKLRLACIGNNKVAFGVDVAEKLFNRIYPNAIPTRFKTKGYDFMLDGIKIDVKASIVGKTNSWRFNINRNKITQTFALMAFDNHEDHNLLHLWFVPDDVINAKISISISEGTLPRWQQYEIDLTVINTDLEIKTYQGSLDNWI